MEGSCSLSKLAIAAGRCGVMRSNSSIQNGFHQVFTSDNRPRSGTRISQLRFESACGCKKLASMRRLRELDVALTHESCRKPRPEKVATSARIRVAVSQYNADGSELPARDAPEK